MKNKLILFTLFLSWSALANASLEEALSEDALFNEEMILQSGIFSDDLMFDEEMISEAETVSQSSRPAQQPTAAKMSAPIDLQGTYQVEDAYGATVSVSTLYWKAYEEGLDYAIKNKGTSGVDNEGRVERASFDWDWGCRVDLGYQVPRKKMDIDLCWTYYETSGTVSDKVDPPNTLFSVWSVPASNGTAYEYRSRAYARLNLNMIDLGISATFLPRRFLNITPFIDLSTVWIYQKFRFDLSGGPGILGLQVVDDRIEMKNDYWGLGPKVGINTLWNLGWGFGICGNFNLSVLYGVFDIKQDEHTTFNGTAPITYLDVDHDSFHMIRCNFDLFLGLRWDRMFCCDRYHLLIEAGWENLLFLGQNQLMRFVNQSNSGINVSGKGDLGIQGLSMRAGFTF